MADLQCIAQYVPLLTGLSILDDRPAFAAFLRVQRDLMIRCARIRGAELPADSPLRYMLAVPDADQLSPQRRDLLAEHGVETREPVAGLEPRAGTCPQLVVEAMITYRRLWEPDGPIIIRDPACPPGRAYLVPANWRRLVHDAHRDPHDQAAWHRAMTELGRHCCLIRWADDRDATEDRGRPVLRDVDPADTLPDDRPS